MYAVILSGGKQYCVSEGEVIRIEELPVESGTEIEFKEVLLVRADDRTYIGQPMVEGAVVKGIVERAGQSEKVLVFKYKKKKQYRRTRGHRQHFSEIRIETISVAQ